MRVKEEEERKGEEQALVRGFKWRGKERKLPEKIERATVRASQSVAQLCRSVEEEGGEGMGGGGSGRGQKEKGDPVFSLCW